VVYLAYEIVGVRGQDRTEADLAFLITFSTLPEPGEGEEPFIPRVFPAAERDAKGATV
jgi:hypothetical protein